MLRSQARLQHKITVTICHNLRLSAMAMATTKVPATVPPQKGWNSILTYHYCLVVTGTMEFYDFPFSWEEYIIPIDVHSIIFQRGRVPGEKPPSRLLLTIINHIRTI